MVAPVSEVLGLLAAGGSCLGSVWDHARLGFAVADSPPLRVSFEFLELVELLSFDLLWTDMS